MSASPGRASVVMTSFIAEAMAWVQRADDLAGRTLPDALGDLLDGILGDSGPERREAASSAADGQSGEAGDAADAGTDSGYFEAHAYAPIAALTTLALRAGGYALAMIGMVLVLAVSMAATAVQRQRRSDALARSLEERIARLEARNRDLGTPAPR